MSSRDDILAFIRTNLPRVDRGLPEVPLFDDNQPASLLAAFKDSLHRMGGGVPRSAGLRRYPGAGPGEDRERQDRLLDGS